MTEGLGRALSRLTQPVHRPRSPSGRRRGSEVPVSRPRSWPSAAARLPAAVEAETFIWLCASTILRQEQEWQAQREVDVAVRLRLVTSLAPSKIFLHALLLHGWLRTSRWLEYWLKTRFFSIGTAGCRTAVPPLAESFEKFGGAALGRSALAMRPSCPP